MPEVLVPKAFGRSKAEVAELQERRRLVVKGFADQELSIHVADGAEQLSTLGV